jgi:hypothetical protein
MIQQGGRCRHGDAGHRSEGAYGTSSRAGTFPPVVDRLPPSASCLPRRKYCQPLGRVGGIGRAHHGDSHPCDAEQDPSNRPPREWSIVDVGTLDEKVRGVQRSSQVPELRPQTTLEYGQMQIDHRLPLHDGRAKEIVANRQPGGGDGQTELLESAWDTAGLLVDIRRDREQLHVGSVAVTLPTKWVSFLAKARKLC